MLANHEELYIVFSQRPEIIKIEEIFSHTICHEPVLLDYNPKKKEGRVKYAHCSSAKYVCNTKYQCIICNIYFCTSLLCGNKVIPHLLKMV